MGAQWVVSRRSGWRGFWGLVGVAVFGWAAVAAIAAALAHPAIDSWTLAAIVTPFALAALVIALEGVGSGVVRLDERGYRRFLEPARAWSDVLAVSTGQVDGSRTPVVAVRADGGFPVTQDTFAGFSGAEASRLVDALRARVPGAPGFAGVVADESWWTEVEAEVARALAVIRATGGPEPVGQQRIVFGYPGLVSAVELDFGVNGAGEHVFLIVRRVSTLALEIDGRRWLSQARRRSKDPAALVAALFGPHETLVEPTPAIGFDQLVVRFPEEKKPLRFNAEEPDRFA